MSPAPRPPQPPISPGDLFAAPDTPVEWPLPWPARLVLAVNPTRDELAWADEYGVGRCSTRHFRARNASYGLVYRGQLPVPRNLPDRPVRGAEMPLTSWHTDHVYALLRRCEAELRRRGVPLKRQRARRDQHQLVLSPRELCTILTALAEYETTGGQLHPDLAPLELPVDEIGALYARLVDIYED